MIWPYLIQLKLDQKQKGKLWAHEIPILEVIFVTLNKKSSIVTNDCREIAKGDASLRSMTLKLPRYFYLLMEKPLNRYFQFQSPYYQAAHCNQKTHIPVSSRWQVRSDKAKKGWASTLITATTHLPRPVSTDLTIKSDSVLTNPIGKDGVRGWSM